VVPVTGSGGDLRGIAGADGLLRVALLGRWWVSPEAHRLGLFPELSGFEFGVGPDCFRVGRALGWVGCELDDACGAGLVSFDIQGGESDCRGSGCGFYGMGCVSGLLESQAFVLVKCAVVFDLPRVCNYSVIPGNSTTRLWIVPERVVLEYPGTE